MRWVFYTDVSHTSPTPPAWGSHTLSNADWDGEMPKSDDQPNEIPLVDLDDWLGTELSFPASPAVSPVLEQSPPIPFFWAEGLASIWPAEEEAGEGMHSQARLSHCRVWLTTQYPAPVAITRLLVRKTSHGIDSSPVTHEFQVIPVTLPAGMTHSAPVSVTPGFTITGGDGAIHSEWVQMDVSLLSVEIQARGGKINDGFDPPLSGDKDINNVWDKDDWVPWTRVAKGGAFPTNELTQLATGSESMAQLLEVVPASDSVDLIEISTRFPDTATYPLTIIGKASTSKTIEIATIDVRFKSTLQVVARMKVLVVPALPQFQLRFFFAEDFRNYDKPGQVPGGTKIRDEPGNTTLMAEEAGECFKQIGVEMVFNGPTTSRNVPYLEPAGEFQTWQDYLPYENKPLMIAAFPPGTYSGGHLQTVLVHAIQGGVGGAYNPETGLVFVAYDKWFPGPVGAPGTYPYWGSRPSYSQPPPELLPDASGRVGTRERAFAHEVGHALLPVRNRPDPLDPPPVPVNGWIGGHDGGPYPQGTDRLMKGRTKTKGKWLRHEDWRTAMIELLKRMGLTTQQ